MATKKPTPAKGKTPTLPWLPPGTPTTWICQRGHINPRTTTTCGSCR